MQILQYASIYWQQLLAWYVYALYSYRYYFNILLSSPSSLRVYFLARKSFIYSSYSFLLFILKIMIFVLRRTTVMEKQLLAYFFQLLSSNKYRIIQTHWYIERDLNLHSENSTNSFVVSFVFAEFKFILLRTYGFYLETSRLFWLFFHFSALEFWYGTIFFKTEVWSLDCVSQKL